MRNIGTFDRILRALAGGLILSLVFVGPQTCWGLLGLIPLVTALTGFCPAYRLIGLSTRSQSSYAEKTR